MLSQKVIDSLKNEPKLLPENQAKYKEILDRHGIRKDSDFYVFMSEYGGDIDGSLGYMINVPEDLSDTDNSVTYSLRQNEGVPDEYISLFDFEYEDYLLYNLADDSVVLLPDGNIECLNNTMLAKVLGEKELMEMNVQTIKDDESLFYKLVDKNFLLIVDWSGEDRQGMLYNFFNNRLQSMLGVQLVVSEDEVYQKYNQEIEEPKRGDFIPFALSYFDKQLEKLGARVVLLDLENDTYNILVAYKKDAKKLKSIKSDFWKLSTLEQKQGRVVISITCPNCKDFACYDMLIEEESNMANEKCEVCGTLFWDENANEVVEMEKTYY